MADRDTRNLLLLGAVGVATFLVARVMFAAKPVEAAAQALTPQSPAEPGLVLRGRNFSAFVPFPNLGELFNTVRPTEDAGNVSVQPGQRMQFVPETAELKMGTA